MCVKFDSNKCRFFRKELAKQKKIRLLGKEDLRCLEIGFKLCFEHHVIVFFKCDGLCFGILSPAGYLRICDAAIAPK